MAQDKYRKLAEEYAPIFAQKVSEEWKLADQIATVDFYDTAQDGTKIPKTIEDVSNNPDKLYKLKNDDVIPAKVYYSVCETTTHYFLIYAVYHVLDWWKRYEPHDLYNYIRDRLDSHIHDMEGALFVVRKEPRAVLDAVVTVFHNNFYMYSEPMIPISSQKYEPAELKGLYLGDFGYYNESVDGNIWLDSYTKRVKLYIQSRGHGIRGDNDDWGGGEEIWYYKPENESKEPGTVSVTDAEKPERIRPVKYTLEDIFANDGLWSYRFNDNVFRQTKPPNRKDWGRWGFVYKNEKGELVGGSANPPWSWKDRNDSAPMGEIATDSAMFIKHYAQGWGPVSMNYIYNPYQAIVSS